jgi:hypothetical protein
MRAVVLVFLVTACSGSTAGELPAADSGAVALDDSASFPDEGSADTFAPVDSADVAADTPSSGSDYDRDGKVPFASSVEKATIGGKSINVTVYMPTSAGAHPVVGFAPGNSQTVTGYTPYAQRLASHGIAVVMRDDPGTFTRTLDIANDFEAMIATWTPMALAGKVDMTRVGLAGHSRGGAVSLLAAERGLKGKVIAWFGLDPVDNQFAMSPGAFARTDIAKIGIPTAYMGSSVASSCSPDADNYKVLYPSSPSPSVLMIGVGSGHTQFATAGSCALCGVCTGPGTADDATVLAYSVRYLTAFFARELLGDKSVGTRFEGAGATADVAGGKITLTSK